MLVAYVDITEDWVPKGSVDAHIAVMRNSSKKLRF